MSAFDVLKYHSFLIRCWTRPPSKQPLGIQLFSWKNDIISSCFFFAASWLGTGGIRHFQVWLQVVFSADSSLYHVGDIIYQQGGKNALQPGNLVMCGLARYRLANKNWYTLENTYSNSMMDYCCSLKSCYLIYGTTEGGMSLTLPSHLFLKEASKKMGTCSKQK